MSQNPPIQQFWALVYKADNVFYQEGKMLAINCNQVLVQTGLGINLEGEIVPLPDATIASPPSSVATVLPSNIFPSPTYFGDSNFKSVVQVKDMTMLCTYYVDTASYNANVINCNFVTN